MQGEILHMTKEIKNKMELKDLEKRRDEINKFQEEINERVKKIFEINKQLQDEYNKLLDQYKINVGALSENARQIEEIKKNDIKEETKEKPVEKTEDKKSKK